MEKQPNSEVRRTLKEKHIALWELAMKIGISESTMIRWMRVEMDDARKELVNQAIKRIIKGGAGK